MDLLFSFRQTLSAYSMFYNLTSAQLQLVHTSLGPITYKTFTFSLEQFLIMTLSLQGIGRFLNTTQTQFSDYNRQLSKQ